MDTSESDVGIANKPHIISDTTNKVMEAYKDTGNTAGICNKLTWKTYCYDVTELAGSLNLLITLL